MVSRAISLRLWVALMVLTGGLRGIASTGPDIPPGVQPLPIDPRGCDPLGNEQRYLHSTGSEWSAYFAHGTVCLDEGRYADAIPKLERAVKLHAEPRDLVALGVAYDGAGRFPEATARWRQARRLYSSTHSTPHFNYEHPIGLESALFERRYAAALKTLEQYFTPHNDSSPYRFPQFEDLGLVQPLSEALHVAAQGNPQRGAELISSLYRKGGGYGEVRYPRAIILLTIGRQDEARFELRLAARRNAPYSSDSGPYPFQWSALTILEHLAASQKR